MRIAYIAPYQGPSLMKARPVVQNLSLAGSLKIELVSRLLQDKNHDVEIISQGEVVERKWRWYSSLVEAEPFAYDIPIHYASALPIRFLNGIWSSRQTLNLFKMRHRQDPFNLAIIYNLKQPQVTCAYYAIEQLGIPIVLEYEDDAFVDVGGRTEMRWLPTLGPSAWGLLQKVSGCIAASPYLLSRLPESIPKLLLRGMIGEDLIRVSEEVKAGKKNWVLFSGTHYRSKGIKQLITAWQQLKIPEWELHITGYGELTEQLRAMVQGEKNIVFHGLVSRERLVQLMCSARVCINPHDTSENPGNVFAFKIIEYLAAGAHVVSTPMGVLENEIEHGITYMGANDPHTIATTLNEVIISSSWRQVATQYVHEAYGPGAMSTALDKFVSQTAEYHQAQRKANA